MFKCVLHTFWILFQLNEFYVYFHFCYSHIRFWNVEHLFHHSWTKNNQYGFPCIVIQAWYRHNYFFLYLLITFPLFNMLNNALGIKKYATYFTQNGYGPLALFYSASFLNERSVANVNHVKWRWKTYRFRQNSYWLQITTKTILILQTYI